MKEIPNEKEFVKYFIFTPSHVVTWIFWRTLAFVFQDSGCELFLYIASLMSVFPFFRPQSTNMCLLILWLVLVYFLLFLRSEPIMCYKVIQEGKKEEKKKDATERMDLQRQAKDKCGACHIVIYLQISP